MEQYSQTDFVSNDKRRQSSMTDVQPYRQDAAAVINK
jgi:hypothetical protein